MARSERVARIIDKDIFKTASRQNSVRLVDVSAHEKGLGAVTATNVSRRFVRGSKP